MKRILPRLLILSLLLPAHFISYSQDITGIWKGYFVSDNGDYYKLEFQISQSKPKNRECTVTGVSYSYLDVRFYGKATMTGLFFSASSTFRIQEIRTVEIKSSLGGGACIMNYNFTYSRSGKEEFLDGTYLGKFETKYKTPDAKWGDCGEGTVHLRRVVESDFYLEPFLRNKIKTDSLDEEIKPLNNNGIPEVTKTIPPPVKKTPVISRPITKTNTSSTKPPVVKNPTGIQNKPIVKSNNNSTNKKTTVSSTNTPAKKIDSAKIIEVPVEKSDLNVKTSNSPDVLKDRENELVKTLSVNDPNVLVKLYDNGEIDGDSISVYLDKKLILTHQMLKATPITIKLKMDEDNTEHELIMVAENLGRIPPNTALMIVESGDKRYSVFITSTEQKNAVVRFKYQKVK